MVEHCNQYLIPIDSHIKWLDIEIVSNKLWIPLYSHDIPIIYFHVLLHIVHWRLNYYKWFFMFIHYIHKSHMILI
jgi:hypothetical protein